MCGIAGVLQRAGDEPVSESVLRRMLGTIRHRGPDEFGIYLGDGVAMGNARLSIIDLGGGQQPISNEDESLWIVFNGEIFNYVELRAELVAKGHRFATHTDTEVIIHLYEEMGPNCLARLNGQWAFAIWDERKQTLFLARDRLGVRPLFYTETSRGQMVFGSEIKSILALPGVKREWDPVALEQIFTYWSPLTPRSSFRGIHSIPPGHYLLANSRQIKLAPYWQLSFPSAADQRSQPATRDTRTCVEAFQTLLVEATKIRLRADVPVGAYLSGGLDSSVIAAIIRRLGVGRLDTFSIAFGDPKFDESVHQQRMAAFLGTDHQVVVAEHSDIGRVFPDVVWHTETPVMRTSPAPMFLLSKLVRSRGYKVVLTGEGADEFLAGYDIFKEALVRRFWARQPNSNWRPRLLNRLYPDIGALSATGDAYLRAFFGGALTETDRVDYSHYIRWKNNRRTCRFFSPDFRAQIQKERDDGGDAFNVPPEFKTWGPLERAQFLEISIFLSQYLLSSQGDRPAMAHSVEGRFPFLDFRVVEFCTQLPPRLKLNGLTEKYLLRQAARDWLPPETLARVKRPYRAPIHQSFFHHAGLDYVRELLAPAALRASGLFNQNTVSQLLTKLSLHRTLGENDEMALVGILSSQLVHQQFFAQPRTGSPLGGRENVKVVSRTSLAALAAGQ